MQATDSSGEDRRFMLANAVISASALLLLGWLLLAPRAVTGGEQLAFMPAVNAGLNGLSAALLLLGYLAVRQGKRDLHKRLMVGAFISSSLFLVGYVTYHYLHGDTRFTGEGTIRWVYFAVLISHVLLSVSVVPLALAALYYAVRQRFSTHTKITRVLFPIWLYVSVTGVAIFFLLRAA